MLSRNPITCSRFIPSLSHSSLFSFTLNTSLHSYIVLHWGNLIHQKSMSKNSHSYVSQAFWIRPHILASLFLLWMDSWCHWQFAFVIFNKHHKVNMSTLPVSLADNPISGNSSSILTTRFLVQTTWNPPSLNTRCTS